MTQTRRLRNRIKPLMLGILLLLMLVPVVQQRLSFAPKVDVGLLEQDAAQPQLGPGSWFDGSYARDAETYASREIGFRNRLVRAMNRIDFQLFGQGTGNAVSPIVLGEDGWIFEIGYAQLYGKPMSMPDGSLERLVDLLVQVQSKLEERGIAFCFVISPSKGEVMDDFLPAGIRERRAKAENKSMYEQLLPELDAAGIRYADGHASLAAMRQRGVKNVFPREGTHWSYYGSYLFCQELLSEIQPQIEQQMLIPDEPEIEFRTADGADNDLRQMLIIRAGVESVGPLEQLPYPLPTSEPLPLDQRPNVLAIGSSFSILTLDSLNTMRATGKLDLLYYFKAHYDVPATDDPKFAVVLGHRAGSFGATDIDWESMLHDKQIVLFEMNEIGLHALGWGFPESLIAYLKSTEAAENAGRNEVPGPQKSQE